MLKEFKEFALRGNVMDMAVGIIIGASFGTIINSLVDDILMPPIGWLLGGVDFSNNYLILKAGSPNGPYPTLGDAQNAGAVTMNYGLFINAIISFLIVAVAMFFLIRSLNQLTAKNQELESNQVPSTKDCPYCFSDIPLQATRCAHCTSKLN
jgi:large conductance mechanosensitive channel